MSDQPLLIALVAIQFSVHALGWAMCAHLTRRWRFAEGHFTLYWVLVSIGLLLYVPAWPSGSAPRNIGNLLLVAAMAIQHRGMAIYWEQRAPDRGYLGLLALAAAIVALSVVLPFNGHGLRVAGVCLCVGFVILATVRLIWRHGRADMPVFSTIVGVSYALFALVLFARAGQALAIGGQTKISIDAPGHSNVPLAILMMAIGGMVNLAQIRLVLGRVFKRLLEQAVTDPLTGAVNRRGLLPQIEELHARAAHGGGHGYAVLMLDVDHFKAVNDMHGHAVGDQVLQRVAQSLREGLRTGDVVARWGGEEFCVLLPRTGLAEARPLAERLTQRIAAAGSPRVTVSIGIAEAMADGESAEQVIRRADEALYRAKEAGRNRVEIAQGSMALAAAT